MLNERPRRYFTVFELPITNILIKRGCKGPCYKGVIEQHIMESNFGVAAYPAEGATYDKKSRWRPESGIQKPIVLFCSTCIYSRHTVKYLKPQSYSQFF